MKAARMYWTRWRKQLLFRFTGVAHHPNLPVDDRRRRFHFVLLTLVGAPMFLVYGLWNALHGYPVVACLAVANLLALLTGIIMLRKMRVGSLVFRGALAIFFVVMAWMFFHGGPHGAKSVWVLTSPLVAFFLMGKIEGTLWAIGLGLGISIAVLLGWPQMNPGHPLPVLIRYLSVYSVITLLTFGFENYRQRSQDRFEREHAKLRAETAALKNEMTVRQQSEVERRRLSAELERSERMRAVGTLAGGVAHDLNNILSGLVNYPEILLMEMPPDSPHRDRIQAIKKSGLKAATIVQDLLALARGGVKDPKPVTLTDVVRDYLASPEFQKLTTDHPSVSITTAFRSDCDHVFGSPVHLSKALMNLVTNAAEAMLDGGTCIITTNSCSITSPPSDFPSLPVGRYATLAVEDTGIGISPADKSRIFEPFYTRKHVGRSGSGLGMAIIWHTIQDHGGFIHTDSKVGRGTTFTLYLPAREPDAACDTQTQDVEPMAACGAGQQILIVDDEAEQRRIGIEVLNRLGYDVTTATSGEGAMAILDRLDVDLVMLDMILGNGSDGLDVYNRIQKHHPGMRVILVSGYSESDRVQTALARGACAYLKKPYTMRQLGDVVQNALLAN